MLMVDSVDEVRHHDIREQSRMDISEQVRTWRRFVALTKYSIAITAAILIILAVTVV
jgi:hypothetical protein